MAKFSFGKNWSSFSEHALTDERVEKAKSGFRALLQDISLEGRRFLDIGFGQGLSLMLATDMGADATGIDIDPLNEDAITLTKGFFPHLKASPSTQIISILDDQAIEALREKGTFDVVHSWGVLHHTGSMWKAIDNAASLVAPGGDFIIAIYNRHWTSPIWYWLKRLYNILPNVLQELAVLCFAPLVVIGNIILKKDSSHHRGMEILHDVRDWLGGYPYEYASIDEIVNYVEAKGFAIQRSIPSAGWTGCNQFVFTAL